MLTGYSIDPAWKTPAIRARLRALLHSSAFLLLSSLAIGACIYFSAITWGIHHETFSFFDVSRQRRIDVDVAFRRDKEVEAEAGIERMPVVVISHGNTVRFTEYSFISNLFAARGYTAISIQHDLTSDAPLVTREGEEYVGRKPVYERGVANIEFVLSRIEKIKPNADYNHLTLVGHSNGGDISMYFAKRHPDLVREVITLDNLRVPLQGAFKILSVRSKDPQFVPDAGVVPTDEICRKSGITVVRTDYLHTDMSDRGPDSVRSNIENVLSKYITNDSNLAPVKTEMAYLPNW